MGGHHILRAYPFDIQKLILRTHLRNRNQLHPFGVTVRRTQQQIIEIAAALGLAQLLLHQRPARLIDFVIRRIQNKTRMRTIAVIAHPELRRGRIQLDAG